MATTAKQAQPMASTLVMPYLFAKQGDSGLEVVIMRRALARAGYGKLWRARWLPQWGDALTKHLNAFRVEHELPLTGNVYTPVDHKQLSRYWDRWNQAQAQKVLALRAENTREARARARVVAELTYLYNERSRIPYSQARPYSRRRPPTSGDCSGSSAWADEQAGLSQMGQPWGYGNTWTQLGWLRSRGREIITGKSPIASVLKRAKPGDYIFYGPALHDPSHTGRYLGADKNGVTRSFQFGRYPAAIREVDYRGDRISVCSMWEQAT